MWDGCRYKTSGIKAVAQSRNRAFHGGAADAFHEALAFALCLAAQFATQLHPTLFCATTQQQPKMAPPRQTEYAKYAQSADIHQHHYATAARVRALNDQLNREMVRTQTLGKTADIPDTSLRQVSKLYGEAEHHRSILAHANTVSAELDMAIMNAEHQRKLQTDAAEKYAHWPMERIAEIQRARAGCGKFLITTKEHASIKEKWVLDENGHEAEGIIRPSKTLSLEDFQLVMGFQQEQATTSDLWKRLVYLHNNFAAEHVQSEERKNEIEVLESALNQARMDLDEVKKEKDSVRTKLDEETKAHHCTKAELDEKVREYTSPDDLSQERDDWRKQTKSEMEQLDSVCKGKIKDVQDRAARKEIENQTLVDKKESDLAEAKKSISNLQDQVKRLEQDKKSMEATSSKGDQDKNDHITSLKTSVAKLESQHKTDKEQWRAASAELEAQVHVHQQELRVKTKSVETLEEQVALQATDAEFMQTLERRVEELAKKEKESTQTITGLRNELNRLGNLHEIARAREVEYSELNRSLHRQMGNLNATLGTATTARDTNEYFLIAERKVSLTLDGEVKRREEVICNLKKTKKQAEEEVGDLKTVVASIAEELSRYDGESAVDKLKRLVTASYLTQTEKPPTKNEDRVNSFTSLHGHDDASENLQTSNAYLETARLAALEGAVDAAVSEKHDALHSLSNAHRDAALQMDEFEKERKVAAQKIEAANAKADSALAETKSEAIKAAVSNSSVQDGKRELNQMTVLLCSLVLAHVVFQDGDVATRDRIASQICAQSNELEPKVTHHTTPGVLQWNLSCADLSTVQESADPLMQLWLLTCINPYDILSGLRLVEQALHVHVDRSVPASSAQLTAMVWACRNLVYELSSDKRPILFFLAGRCLEIAFRLGQGLSIDELRSLTIKLCNIAAQLPGKTLGIITALLNWLENVANGSDSISSPAVILEEELSPALLYRDQYGQRSTSASAHRYIRCSKNQLFVFNRRTGQITSYWKSEVQLSVPDTSSVKISFLAKRRLGGSMATTEAPFVTDCSPSLDWETEHLPAHCEALIPQGGQ